MQRKLKGSFEADLEKMMESGGKAVLELNEFEKSVQDDGFYESLRCVKFVFGRDLRRDAKSVLHTAGVIHRVMYPDFEGLAKSVKEDCFVGVDEKNSRERVLPSKRFDVSLQVAERL